VFLFYVVVEYAGSHYTHGLCGSLASVLPRRVLDGGYDTTLAFCIPCM
jgi:hypothetical protein